MEQQQIIPSPVAGRQPQPASDDLRLDWPIPQPLNLPAPTYWPAIMALGTIMALGGLVTSWIITAVGLGLIALSLTGWIGEIRHEP